MPQGSVGAEDGDSCEYIQGGKDCYMPQDSVGAEDGDSYGFNTAVRTGSCLRTASKLMTVTAVSTTKAGRIVICLRTT